MGHRQCLGRHAKRREPVTPPGQRRRTGVLALRQQPPGSTPRLTDAQKDRIPALLDRGATFHGFIGEGWIAPRVGVVIKEIFGVQPHETHVRRLIRELVWTTQKPVQRASHRDEAAIAAWRAERWSALKIR